MLDRIDIKNQLRLPVRHGYLNQNKNEVMVNNWKLNIVQTVELQWLEHLWDHGNLFETWVVRATEG